MSIKSNKVDFIIEAARFFSNGRVEKVRAYVRRGPTFSDCVLLSRAELVSYLQRGKRVVTGQRIHGLASTFENIKYLCLIKNADAIIITTNDHFPERDFLNNVPLI